MRTKSKLEIGNGNSRGAGCAEAGLRQDATRELSPPGPLSLARARGKKTGALLALVVLGVLAAGCAKVSGSDGWARPEVADKVMYVTLEKGKLTAIDTGTFQKIWTFPAAEEFACGGGESKKIKPDGIYGSPAIDGANVYFGTYDGAVYAVKQSDGTCVWRIETGDTLQAAPILGSEGLYVGANDGNVYLLDPKNGDQKQKFNSGAVWAAPLLKDDGLYVSTMTGKLWKLDPKTLEPVWSAPFKVSAGLLTPPTAVGDDTIVVGGIGKQLYGIDRKTGAEKWSVTGGNWFWGEPFVDGTTVYATDLDGQVTAIDGTNGNKLWDAPFAALNAIRSGPVMAENTLVAVDNGGVIYRIDPATGKGIGQPNLLNEDVHASPLVLNADGTQASSLSNQSVSRVAALATSSTTPSPVASGTPTPAPSGSAGAAKVYIVTTGGHLFEFDPDAGRTSQVVSK